MNPLLDIAFDHAERALAAVGGDVTALPLELQTVLLVISAQGPIDNGGLCYFFGSDFPGRPPYQAFVAAYERIGARVPAARIQAALDLFPFADPEADRERRCEWLESNRDAIEQLDDGICGEAEVYSLLADYAQRHREAFRLDEQPPRGSL